MFSLKFWLNLAMNPHESIWIEATLIKETPKALKIIFDGKEIWLSKAWILRIKRSKIGHWKPNETISIKISPYRWAKI